MTKSRPRAQEIDIEEFYGIFKIAHGRVEAARPDDARKRRNPRYLIMNWSGTLKLSVACLISGGSGGNDCARRTIAMGSADW